MSTITRVKEWTSGEVLTAADLNAEFDAILSDYDGSISNANIASDAAIASTKISGTAVTLTGTETLTNKTITTPTITGPTITGPTITGTIAGTPTITTPTLTKPIINGSTQGLTADSDGATITFNMTSSNIHTVTLGGNRTLAVSNVSAGQAFVIRLVQDGTGSRTVTWFSTLKWADGTAPTLTTTASKTDVFGFLCTSSGNYDAYIIGQNL